MSKRRRDESIWRKSRYRNLEPHEKLVLLFWEDHCDIAGFVTYDVDDVCYNTKLEKQEALRAIKGLEGASAIVRRGTEVWVKRFIEDQDNLPLDMDNNAHWGIIKLLRTKKDRFPEAYEFAQEFDGKARPLKPPQGG